MRAHSLALPGRCQAPLGRGSETLGPGSERPRQAHEAGPGQPLTQPPFCLPPLDSKQNGDANAVLSDEEGAGLTQPLASAPTPEERRALRRSGPRDKNKKAAACFLLSAGDYTCADGSVRKGMAPRAGQGGAPMELSLPRVPPRRKVPSSPEVLATISSALNVPPLLRRVA